MKERTNKGCIYILFEIIKVGLMYDSLHPLLLIKPSERSVEGRVNFLTIKLAAFDYFIAAD